jgi:hypothetical protein
MTAPFAAALDFLGYDPWVNLRDSQSSEKVPQALNVR